MHIHHSDSDERVENWTRNCIGWRPRQSARARPPVHTPSIAPRKRALKRPWVRRADINSCVGMHDGLAGAETGWLTPRLVWSGCLRPRQIARLTAWPLFRSKERPMGNPDEPATAADVHRVFGETDAVMVRDICERPSIADLHKAAQWIEGDHDLNSPDGQVLKLSEAGEGWWARQGSNL